MMNGFILASTYQVYNVTTTQVIAECERQEDAEFICAMYEMNPHNEFTFTVVAM